LATEGLGSATRLPARFSIRAYTCPDALPGFEAVAHVFAPSTDARTGVVKLSMLPATQFGPSPEIAAERLTAFLTDEIAKATAKSERGRSATARLNERRSRRPGSHTLSPEVGAAAIA